MLTPTLTDFMASCQTSALCPVWADEMADLETPVSAFYKLGALSDYAFLLESVTGGERIARYSYIGVGAKIVWRANGRDLRETIDGEARSVDLGALDPISYVSREVTGKTHLSAHGLPPFSGGAVGWIGYDAVRLFERLPKPPTDDLKVDDLCLVVPSLVIAFDHAKRQMRLIATIRSGDKTEYEAAEATIADALAKLKAPIQTSSDNAGERASTIASNRSPEDFMAAARRAKEYIYAGDAIQVVLSQRFETEADAPPFDIYRALRSLNPSPYMFYFKTPSEIVLGASPEILVSVHDRKVTVRPIAGTRRRGESEDEDRRLEAELLSDEKELAEHVMLVDLGRNDVGRVSEFGTVSVRDLMVVERYSHVMHIVSEVQGRLKEGLTAADALKATFPAGTVSGAPKVRAMQIIDELEPTKRGLYAGALGYIGFSGDMDLCITIRTILIKDGKAYVQSGAGIVADSEPELELAETENKARAALAAIEMARRGL
ncbi:MAG: anthranilate synthase component I [Armatimonadetes bacterium]|nr:anthranilate synthase component I [Armatimonadota bacterium]